MDIQNNIGDMANTYLEKNGWNEWAKYVLMSLEELKANSALMDDKIDTNKVAYIEAINRLEVSITTKMGEFSAEVKVLKKELAIRSVAVSSVIPIVAGIVYGLFRLIGG